MLDTHELDRRPGTMRVVAVREAAPADLRTEVIGVSEGSELQLDLRLVTELPLAPVCRDDCPGLCPECGALLAEDPTHQHEAVDPRWAALRTLTTSGSPVATGTMGGSAADDEP